MKKSLLALAVLGAFAGAASAQSAVTLYGRVDAGFARIDPSAGTVTNQSARTGLDSGHLGGSRWGLRGSEDLGGGLRGVFVLESGFGIDDGMSGQGGRLFGRQAYLGVTGNFGGLVMGRLATFSSGTGDFDRIGTLDPFRTGYPGLGMQATFASMNALRLDNAIAYVTPDMGGFSAGLGYTFRAGGQELAGGSSNNNAGIISYVNFRSGPFYGVVTYDRVELGEVTGDPTQTHLQAGMAWDFKVARVSIAFAQESDQFALLPANIGGAAALQGAGTDASAWMIGAVIPRGAHRFAISYQDRTADAIGTTPEGERTVWTVGYEYAFSRRTTAYIVYGDVSDKGSYKTANWGGTTNTFIGLSHSF